jgi:hypothetical protein
LPRLGPGDYRIQVECVPGEYGRVHRVTLGHGRTVVHVDSHFDAAAQSGDGVSLRYGSAPAAARFALRHAIEVGRLVGARYVVVIAPEPAGDGVIRVSRLEVERGKVIAQVVARLDASNEIVRLPEVLAALREGQSTDFSGEAPAPIKPVVTIAVPATSDPSNDGAGTALEAAEAPSSYRDTASSDGPGFAAWTLAGAGTVIHIVGWVLYAHHLGLESDYRKVRNLDDPSEAQRRMARIDDFELVPPLVASGGALLGTAALPLLLPPSDRRGVPGWSLGVGLGGLALAGAGAGLLVRRSGCDDFDRLARCDDVVTTTHLGALLVGAAVPLLSVPVIHFIRSRGGSTDAALSVDVSHTRFALSWKGTL